MTVEITGLIQMDIYRAFYPPIGSSNVNCSTFVISLKFVKNICINNMCATSCFKSWEFKESKTPEPVVTDIFVTAILGSHKEIALDISFLT